MKINETITKTFTFSCEDAQIVNAIMLNQIGKKTIKTVLDNERWYMPLFSAYGKITGSLRMIDYTHIRFTGEEKRIMCEVLQKAWAAETDETRKEKIRVLLEGIFNN